MFDGFCNTIQLKFDNRAKKKYKRLSLRAVILVIVCLWASMVLSELIHIQNTLMY